MRTRIEAAPGAKLDYIAIVDRETFLPARKVDAGVLIALAVKFGETRLIDNLALS
jgi:pantoate--beta-alanine ligase